MKEIFTVFKNKKCLVRMVISGILFLLVAAPFKSLLTLVPGMTEVRPANMIPPVLGLIWGPAAAWGISIANAISDIVASHSPFIVWFPGMIINFFFAYLPYKMWYSLGHIGSGTVKPNLNSVFEILKFIYVCFIDSLVTTVLLVMLFEYLGFQTFTSSVLLLFFNNFDFTIVLGIPVVLLLSNTERVGFWIPEDCRKPPLEGKAREIQKNRQQLSNALLYAVGIFGVIYYFASRFNGFVLGQSLEFGLLALFILIEIFYITKPFSPLKKTKNVIDIRRVSIRAKVIIGFLLLSVFFVLIIGAATFLSQRNVVASDKDLWQYIYTVVGISLNILFVVSLLFLRYVEVNVTNPLEILAKGVKQFAARDHQTGEDTESSEIIQSCQQIRTGDEIEGLSDSFGTMMIDIENYVVNLAAVTKEKERIGAELNVATQIQADMLPRIFPAFPEKPEIDIFASMTPAKEVGGDFYDFFLVDDNHLAIVIADVSGKGVPAALFMVIAKTLIKNHAQLGEDPAAVFTNANEQLCEGNEAGLFVTAWMGVLNLTTGHFVYVNAGHNPPMLMRKGENFQFLKSKVAFVLAGMEGVRYKQAETTLYPGDRIYLYTDGVTEATDIHDELYGEDRLEKALNERKDLSVREMLVGVKASVDNFFGEADQFDDITMLGLEYKGKGGTSNA